MPVIVIRNYFLSGLYNSRPFFKKKIMFAHLKQIFGLCVILIKMSANLTTSNSLYVASGL